MTVTLTVDHKVNKLLLFFFIIHESLCLNFFVSSDFIFCRYMYFIRTGWSVAYKNEVTLYSDF